MRNKGNGINIGSPPVIDVGDPIYQTNGFAVYVNLKTITIVDPKIIGMDIQTSFSNGKNSIRHLEIDDFATLKTHVSHWRIGVIILRDKSGK
jgi:hypothetical protein